MKIKCPSCEHGFNVELKALVPESQRLVMELTKGDGCEFFDAKTISGVIAETAKLLRATAREVGYPVEVFVSEMGVDPAKARIEFLIVRPEVKPVKAGAK